MQFDTQTSPHLAGENSVAAMMRQVLYALVPGTLALIWFFGWGVLINLVLATIFATALEALVMVLRKRPVKAALGDYSAVVTAWLLAVTMPPLSPWWLTLIAVFFAIVVAKHLYGGLGYNPFNPAMVGYVVCLISFPVQMTSWLAPSGLAEHSVGFLASLQTILTGQLPASLSWDAITMATPLDNLRTETSLGKTLSEIRAEPLYGSLAGQGWEWAANFFFLGGFWLLYKKIITWHVPVALIVSLGVMAALFSLGNPDNFPPPTFHIFSGGAILGAFFIATDPVSGATSPRGRIVFGAGVGVLTYIIRTWGGYPDGIAFAVLLMNMAAPTIDYYTKPRVFGHKPE
ncbi:MAG TPA: electron transport complex subunit RsxD [Chromatiales bacterium]|nr:electron transport complex subunit RsxD [Thiotrichales bacterium]HIP68946.1 electron transport complex subunit RsxD [Chromatiales bacterium]